MSIRQLRTLPRPDARWVDQNGVPLPDVFQYFREADDRLRRLIAISNPVLVADLEGTEGDIAYASNGRKAGEGAGLGTGVLVFHDGTNWIAVDTGAAVAA